MTDEPREPTGDECNANAKIGDGFACWYPQMGGYVAKCVVVPIGDGPDVCFDAWVWHDGQFPFDSDDARGRSPARLHHCSAEQFERFGALVRTKMGGVES